MNYEPRHLYVQGLRANLMVAGVVDIRRNHQNTKVRKSI